VFGVSVLRQLLIRSPRASDQLRFPRWCKVWRYPERFSIETFARVPPQYNVNAQYEVFKDYLLEVGYVGTHGINLFRQIGINQARLASAASPITNAVTGA